MDFSRSGLIWLRVGQVVGVCGCGNKPSVYKKCGENLFTIQDLLAYAEGPCAMQLVILILPLPEGWKVIFYVKTHEVLKVIFGVEHQTAAVSNYGEAVAAPRVSYNW